MIVPFMKTQVVNDLINSLLESNRRYSILLVLVDMSLEKDGLIEGSGLLTIKKISLNNKVSSSRSRNIGIEYIVNHNVQFDYLLFPDDDTTFDSSFFDLYFAERKSVLLMGSLYHRTSPLSVAFAPVL